MLQSLSPRITAAGGHVFAVTSEAESELPKMRTASGYTGETIVDPENLLAKELKRRGVLDVAISEKKGYPHGMAQPAILVGGKEKIWYHWAIVPATVSTTLRRRISNGRLMMSVTDEFRRRKGQTVVE